MACFCRLYPIKKYDHRPLFFLDEVQEVFPYSFSEYLKAHDIDLTQNIADRDTRKREIDALLALADYQDVQHLQIVTKDEEETLEENGNYLLACFFYYVTRVCINSIYANFL